MSFQLGTLAEQLKMFPERVKIVVADNNSNDAAVKGILDNYESLPNFHIIRRPFNVEGNANILQGFLEARKSDFLWILADDTQLEQNALIEIFRAIDQSDANLIGLHLVDQNDLPEKISWEPSALARITGKFQWGLISSALYEMRFFGEDTKSAFMFHNSSFPHLGVLLSALKRHGQIKIKWVLESKVHSGNNNELKSDYSLALCGFPHLFLFLDRKERKKIVRAWIFRYGAAFLHYSRVHEVSSKASLQIIKESGLLSQMMLLMSRIEVLIRHSSLGKIMEPRISKSPAALKLIGKLGRLPFRIHTSSTTDK